jgi:lipoyl(octanoyl) transferase
MTLRIDDQGLMEYRQAWALQEAVHQQVTGGADERLLLVEHPPVITFGRRGDVGNHLLAAADQLAKLGVDLVHSDRGGDITFHGPGQLVVYPIIRLNDHGLSVGGYVRMLQTAVIKALAEIGVCAWREDGVVGVWTDEGGKPAKICAIGVRIRRGVSMHGLALNVDTNLNYFNLIVPCGLSGRPVTSVRKLLGSAAPSMTIVKSALVRALQSSLATVESLT